MNAKIQSASVDAKETIYIDIDDEITGIIEKIRGAGGKIVALVLPKRATVLQSIVNMKLLKRAAEDAKKHLVLVTSEAGLMPLAGAVGLHVAATPTSKPSIPPAPELPDETSEDIDEPLEAAAADDEQPEGEFDPKAAAATAVGDLAGGAATSKLASSPVDETLELDDDEPETPDAAAPAKAVKPKPNKKLKVPNFDSFRKRLLLGGFILLLLIAAWIVAFVVMPRAKVVISTDTSTIPTNLNLTLDTAAKALDIDAGVVPAVAQTTQKSYTQQVDATGQQNNGKAASGNVYFALKNCNADTVSIPAGTGISSGGNTYITQAPVNLQSVHIGSTCNPSALQQYWSTTIKVVALSGGTQSNIPDGSGFTLPSNVDGISSVKATANGDIDGGTDDIIKVVAQSDIDGAKDKIKAASEASVQKGLQSVLEGKGLMPVPVTFVAGDPQVTTSAKAGDQADTVTVTEVISYTMLGVQQSDIKQLVVANVTDKLDKGKQSILDDGVAKANFTAQSPATAAAATVTMQAKSVAGPKLDATALKKEVAGKKSGDIKKLIKETPGVTDVQVKYSPFWVTATPKNADKITIQIDKSGSK
jgi:hypothetical protein